MRFDDAMPLSPSTAGAGCAVLVRRGTGQWDATCGEPPVVEVDWRFEYPTPHVASFRLCGGHRAALCGREQYCTERLLVAAVGPLYDATVEDNLGT